MVSLCKVSSQALNSINFSSNFLHAHWFISLHVAGMDVELSEEERAALVEGRQRSDKISRLMGAYLLKRYRMLSETCYVCKVKRHRLARVVNECVIIL